ncbi:hypothetical protein [Exiguobacterium acetylicum]|uniref:hypothetical protein n=1 Tax=Exiguobacterium acetylicum TaxID=41170 RepID=UPI0012E31F36|nr:hypothetical protein [Exiguobacterium acetylicum]
MDDLVDKNIIEKRAVSAIDNLCDLDSQYRLNSRIPVGDKEISYDGNIEVFKDNTRTKLSFLFKVPVQVKGTEVKNFSKDYASFRKLTRKDLKVYLRGNGVLFFLVEQDKYDRRNNKIFCYPLLPIKIIELLELKQETYTLKCTHISDDGESLFNYCIYFKENSDRQAQITNREYFSNFDFKSFIDKKTPIKISVVGQPSINAFFSPFKQLYFSDKGLERPIHNVEIQSISSAEKISFNHQGIVYSLDKKITESKNQTEVIIGNAFHIISKFNEPNKINLSINTNSSSLVDKKYTLLFLKTLIAVKEIGGKEKKGYEEIIYYLERVVENHQKIYTFFSLNEDKKINLDSNDQTVTLLLFIIEANDEFFTQLSNSGFYSFPFGDIQLNVSIDIEEKTLYPAFSQKVEDLYGIYIENVSSISSDDPLTTSLYFSLFKELPLDSTIHEDLNSSRVIRSFKKNSDFNNEDIASMINLVVLNCIKKYDISKDVKYLEIAKGLTDELENKHPQEPIFIINSAQIEFRINNGKLTENTIVKLITLKSLHVDKVDVQVAISILLKEDNAARILFSLLKRDEKDSFSNYPIFYLAKFKNS